MYRKRKIQLKKYIRISAKALGADVLLAPPLSTSMLGYPEIHSLTSLAQFSAKQFGVGNPQLSIKFNALVDGQAGHTFMNYGTWYIEINNSYHRKGLSVTAIVAHEMAHVALGIRGVRIELPAANEELTDTVAILAGYGHFLSAACSQQKVNPLFLIIGIISIKNKKIGYLTKSEVDYIAKIKNLITGQKPIARWRSVDFNEEPFVLCYGCLAKLRTLKKSGTFVLRCPICQLRQRIKFRAALIDSPSVVKRIINEVIDEVLYMADTFRGFEIPDSITTAKNI